MTNPATPAAELLALRADALEIFDGPECAQAVRDAIEWYAASVSVILDRAAPAPVAEPADLIELARRHQARIEVTGVIAFPDETHLKHFVAAAAPPAKGEGEAPCKRCTSALGVDIGNDRTRFVFGDDEAISALSNRLAASKAPAAAAQALTDELLAAAYEWYESSHKDEPEHRLAMAVLRLKQAGIKPQEPAAKDTP